MATTTNNPLEAAMADPMAFWSSRMGKPVEKVSADLTKVPSYHAALGAPYSPRATVAHLADQLEADGVAIVRESYGFRTMTPAEKAALIKKAA